MKFERKDARVTVAFLKCVRGDWRNRPFNANVAARAIKEGKGWRVDRADAVAGTWTPWEPITTETYPTLAAAKKAIREFNTICRLPLGSPERKRYVGFSGSRKRRRKRRR